MISMIKIAILTLCLLAFAFAMGFSMAFLYITRRSKLSHARTGAMLEEAKALETGIEKVNALGVIDGRLQVTDEVLKTLQFKRFK